MSTESPDLPACDLEIDASGFRCPMPLLKAKQGLNQLQPGQILRLVATDPGSVRDFRSFTALTAHRLLELQESGDRYIFTLQKGG